MCKSMTGYGSSEFSIGDHRFSIETKSVNHRFIDINIKLPYRFSSLENKIREAVKRFCYRGSFYITITTLGTIPNVSKVNIPLAKHYLEMLKELQRELGLKDEIDIMLFLQFKDIFLSEQIEHDVTRDWEGVQQGLKNAIDSLLQMRKKEGLAISNDIIVRMDILMDNISKMCEYAPILIETYKQKLKERLVSLLNNIEIDKSLLLRETAILAEKNDVTEELTRLNSHLMQFKGILQVDEPIGRKMDFLCQEILREINTIGSKSNDLNLTNLVISSKVELEKIREQVQNIE